MKGALEWLKRAEVKVITMEFKPKTVKAQGHKPEDMLGWLLGMGYKFVKGPLMIEDNRSIKAVIASCQTAPKSTCDLLLKKY